ncbi:cell division protein Fic [Williamsoniiplasma luminosum]|uniref:Cell division protein Fic n=1 Tax=Williamsoniiplasma luminosum TaxID=214888 RepID=A0A2K8NSP5_9MOLU|nr:Fic family protein [Williamsoniiplasma luminosum]ATZ16819.1 cell division protein Fic [Williamsoniiplasma luminosum]
MKLTKKYLEDLKLRDAFNSSHIEGNTLTFGETYCLLLDNKTPNRTVNLRELNEVQNYESAWNLIEKSLNHNKSVSKDLIRDIHFTLTSNIKGIVSGEFRDYDVLVSGSNTIPPAHQNIYPLMDNFLYKFESLNIDSLSVEKKYKAIISFHLEFESIHPFQDGNGRIGRSLMIFQCLQHDLAPLIIKETKRTEYISLVSRSSEEYFKELSVNDTTSLFYDHFKEDIIEESKRFKISQDEPTIESNDDYEIGN